jgi:hypothetical protein
MREQTWGYDYQPMCDEYYEAAANRWNAENLLWQEGKHPEQLGPYAPDCKFFWEWSDPPDREYYRDRDWTEAEATHYQMYETVSEGTPASPIFASLDELKGWLISDGYSAEAAAAFCQSGWAPSMGATVREGQPPVFKNDLESLVDDDPEGHAS